MEDEITRRQAVKRLFKLGGAAAVTMGSYGGLYGRTGLAGPAPVARADSDFRVPGAPEAVAVVQGGESATAEALIRKAIDALGGMSRYVSRGDVVALKLNMSWDRPPELAANTSPEAVMAMVGLCYEAGAARVKLVDNTINDARRVFRTTCLDKAASSSGADLIYPESRLFKTMNLGGVRLGDWKVFTPVVEADKLINMPVAKHHGLTRLTLGMKNWIGAVGGARGALHQDIHQSVVDLARFFRPTLTVVDAIRIMVRNGPSGGRLADVETRNTIIAGTDQVAVDGAATGLFGLWPDDVGYIVLAERQGLGRAEPASGSLIEVKI